MEIFALIILVVLAGLLFSAFRVLREYERGVVFMLGRFYSVKGPGLIIIIPIIQQMVRVDLRTIVLDIPTVWAQNTEEYLSKGLAVHDQFVGSPLIRTTFAPHAPYTVSDDAFRQIRTLADELDVQGIVTGRVSRRGETTSMADNTPRRSAASPKAARTAG